MMIDDEIALAKAMLGRGLKNDVVHFYFNRADRLISSGRIAQIRSGKYGGTVPEAAPEILDAFLLDRATAHAAETPGSSAERTALRGLFSQVAGAWHLLPGETDRIECKRGFRLSPQERFADIIRSVAGLANNSGGYIFIGIANGTYAVEGLPDDRFVNADPAEINRLLVSSLDPVPQVTSSVLEVGGRKIGVLHVAKHGRPPVLATKNIGTELRDGTIYFRYVGETRAIRPGELRYIIAEREQRAVADFSKRIARLGKGVDATLNLDTGEIEGKAGRLFVDKSLLPAIQFVREGDFEHRRGAPALRLVGEVEPVDLSGRMKVRIVRENVTPDAIVRNFLRGEQVADPLQYIQAQAHCQRRWLPVWYYVAQLDHPLDTIIERLRAEPATYPVIRDVVVARLLRKETAWKVHAGKPARLGAELARGNLSSQPGGLDDLAFSNAVMGLPRSAERVERLKPALLACLERAEARGQGTLRSAVCRAACRIDELLHGRS
jgi:hypothetical protein